VRARRYGLRRHPDDPCPPGAFFADPKLNKKGECTNRFRQPRLAKHGGRNESDIRYNQLALAQGSDATTILGSQFNQGRVDGYRLRDGNLLPKGPTFHQGRLPYRPFPASRIVRRPRPPSAGVLPGSARDQSAGAPAES
jgi:hypothetical protein